MSAQSDAVAALTAAVNNLSAEVAKIVAAVGNPPADPAVVAARDAVNKAAADLAAAVPAA